MTSSSVRVTAGHDAAPDAGPGSGDPGPDSAPVSTRRSDGIGRGIAWLATWSLRLLLVAAGAVLLGVLLGRMWSIVLPVVLALLVTTVLWPPTAFLRRHLPPAAAALLVLVGSLILFLGGLGALAPSVVDQVGDIASQAAAGLERVQEYVTGAPLNFNDAQVDAAVSAATDRLQSSASTVASGVLTGVTAVTNGLVTLALVLVLVFFFLKDGPRFLPWLQRTAGGRAAPHLDVVLRRSWATLGSFIRGQALVGLVDAVLIGIGLVLCGVPLALPLAVLTFFGGFVPIIGAFVVGALAVLVALVTKGPTIALIVLLIILAVQQIEGNVLQPLLQGKSLQLHPAVVILAVAAGSGLYGITGAFLSVPVVAVAAVVLRYLGEVLDGTRPDEAAGTDEADSTDAEVRPAADRAAVGQAAADQAAAGQGAAPVTR
ncbi:MAG TPA: AI-2E family transporter [Mycobacteriales bacterium]|jgi:predicted PurR-regulated permease PerM|nr:AI-2E family transporter [Mycobacteriales bacterium]